MKDQFSQIIANSENREVLKYLEGKSAHSDITGALLSSVTSLGDVFRFSPSADLFSYTALSTKNVIFAFAMGQATIGVRLDEKFKNRAVKFGADDCTEISRPWVTFEFFRSDYPEPDLDFWLRTGYRLAR